MIRRAVPAVGQTAAKSTSQILLRLIDTLSLAPELPQIKQVLGEFTASTGFQYFACLFLRGHDVNYITNYPDVWQERYARENLLAVDPVIFKARSNHLPFKWSIGDLPDNQQSETTRLFQGAARVGITAGCSIGVPAGFRERSILTLSGRSFPNPVPEIDPVLATVALGLLRSHLDNITPSKILTPEQKLSPRETECLRWFAEGMPMPDIAVILNISTSSVRFYLSAACRKLGATNNRQASMIATRRGLI